jgi:hypothetical protein
VREAAVVPKPDQHGEHRLVAYVVPAGDTAPSVTNMRNALAASLPDYMLPSAFVSLPTLPLLPFGKVDRNALPAPNWGRPAGSDYIGPRTPVEETLAQLWSELLGVQQFGVHDSFFDLGGNSLLAAQAIGRANTALGIDLPLSALFDAPTVEQQALMIAQRLAERVDEDELAQLVTELEALEGENDQRGTV